MSGEDKSEDVEKSGETEMKPIGILAVGLILGMVIGVAVGAFILPQIQGFGAPTLKPEVVGEKTVDFISNYGGLPPGVDVELINVTEVEDANLYKITFNLSMQGIILTVEPYEAYMTKDGKILFPQGIDMEEFEEKVKQQEEKQTIGDFIVSEDEICMEDEKPIIYFFGSEGCGGCRWEHPVMENVTAKFVGYISFHDNMDNSTADRDIFDKYSPEDYIPTIVLGCKYYRVGPGASMGENQEAKVLTALICNLTGNKPVDVCTDPEIEELINRI